MCHNMLSPPCPDDEPMLERLQWVSLSYYLRNTNPTTGLVADKSQTNSATSITAVGILVAISAPGRSNQHRLTANIKTS